MCLILLAHHVHPDFDTLLAGNRDELKGRPSAPPALIASQPRVWAGRDLEAGGTWMGRNEAGLMAALTNRRSEEPEPEQPRSRGEIVTTVLGRRTLGAAVHWLAGLDTTCYRPFSILLGNQEAFCYLSSAEPGPPRWLEPGFHALSNSALDDRSWPKVARSHEFFERCGHLGWEALLEELKRFLGDPTPPDDLPAGEPGDETHGPMGAVFIRHPVYGTVSSTIFTAGGKAGDAYYYAEGEALAADPAAAFQAIPME